jgi:hypothetical protein
LKKKYSQRHNQNTVSRDGILKKRLHWKHTIERTENMAFIKNKQRKMKGNDPFG